jgi:hypothetical protein
MLSEAGIRHALVGALAANAYRDRPRTTEDVDFLVGDEAFESHPGGFVTMRVPVIEFDGIDIDQVPLTPALRLLGDVFLDVLVSDGVPMASLETVVAMKLIAGRSQDHADIEAMVASGADRYALAAFVERTLPGRLETLRRLYANADRQG